MGVNVSNEKNEIELVALYKDISDHAKTQIDQAWKSYKWVVGAAVMIFSIATITFFFLYGRSYETLEKNIQQKIAIVSKMVEQKIETEFNTKKIQNLIHNEAVEQTSKKLSRIVKDQIKPLEDQIQIIKGENEKALNDLLIATDLILALNNAYYEISSLRKLKEISENQDPKIAMAAKKSLQRIVEEIEQTYIRLNSDYWGFTFVDDQYYGLKSTSGWDLAKYLENYKNMPTDRKVVYVNNYLSNDKTDDISKFRFSLSILKTEKRPEIIYTICAFVNTKSKLNKDYLFESEEYRKWLSGKIGIQ